MGHSGRIEVRFGGNAGRTAAWTAVALALGCLAPGAVGSAAASPAKTATPAATPAKSATPAAGSAKSAAPAAGSAKSATPAATPGKGAAAGKASTPAAPAVDLQVGLRARLADPDPEVRRRAALDLARDGGPLALPMFWLLLDGDDNAEVRKAAAQGLGGLAHPWGNQRLVQCDLSEPDPGVKDACRAALGIEDPAERARIEQQEAARREAIALGKRKAAEASALQKAQREAEEARLASERAEEQSRQAAEARRLAALEAAEARRASELSLSATDVAAKAEEAERAERERIAQEQADKEEAERKAAAREEELERQRKLSALRLKRARLAEARAREEELRNRKKQMVFVNPYDITAYRLIGGIERSITGGVAAAVGGWFQYQSEEAGGFKTKVVAWGVTLAPVYYFGKSQFKGFYGSLPLSYTKGSAEMSATGFETSFDIKGWGGGAVVGHAWMWDNFILKLGGGVQYFDMTVGLDGGSGAPMGTRAAAGDPAGMSVDVGLQGLTVAGDLVIGLAF